MNTAIRTIYLTSYLNTILTILKLNRFIYENTVSITLNNTINLHSRIITLYSTFLIKACCSSLYSSRSLINTICRIHIIFTPNMADICVYINTTTRTINFTIYLNTIITILKLNRFTYINTITIITINNTIN